jgi:DNA invertase Pin-like site-specific DNA recombinase
MTAKLRCAVYTRKSSDEGLDQAFNSLDAQREAGEAYIKSQASEGWRALPARYDDGGYSGGTMERPALRRLLADVDAGLVDVIVVYKIDRLTRSLADFARIVERFDARGVSFVSVTQAFNTTSSMGRLTLNVLLSFAQFEREVTGERIRDKIAASKAKGMWMGGVPSLGYDLPLPGSRTLQLNEVEAGQVKHIYARYLELGSVHQLQQELSREGIVSKRRTTAQGKVVGGLVFSRGALFHMLRSRLYLGEIPHKDRSYPAEHPAIVSAELFDAVQARLAAGRRPQASQRKVAGALLTGRIVDASGEVMSPAFSYGRGGRVYRYYVSASLQQGRRSNDDGVLRRISARTVEALVTATLERLLPTKHDAISELRCVQIGREQLQLTLPYPTARLAEPRLAEGEAIQRGRAGGAVVTVPIHLPRRGSDARVAAGARDEARPDPVLIASLRKAHRMLERCGGLPWLEAAPASAYDRRVMRFALLAPDIQRAILAGRQAQHFNLEFFMKREIPLCWDAQQQILGRYPRSLLITENA